LKPGGATHVAIIGGGYAGMAAAVTLAAQSIPTTVFEAGKQLGGRARRVVYRNTILDNGLHVLIGAYSETQRLIRAVSEPGDAAPFLEIPLQWKMQGELSLRAPRLPAPLHMLFALLFARGIGWRERIDAARFMQAQRNRGYRLEHDISVAQLLQQAGQNTRICALLWQPLCVAALNTPADTASAQVFLNVLRDSLGSNRREASDLLLPRVDLTALFPDRAARYISTRDGRVLLAHSVESIQRKDAGMEVSVAGKPHRFSHVICALPPHRVSALLASLPELAGPARLIDAFRYEPIHSIYLQYPRSLALPAPMIGLSGGMAQWIFDRERICSQHGLIGAVISASRVRSQTSQEQIAAAVHAQLTDALGPLPAPVWQRVIAEKRASFACTVGLRRPAPATSVRNFYFAGDYTESDYPATLEGAVRSGVACARMLIDRERQ
jgi:squalene-associated FAD-dependent desaturase